jgi:retron-type reverse transcriptase
MRKKVNWILDANIRGFFDDLSHEGLVKFIEHRIADRRILRLIQKWLKAGVYEEGKWSKTEVGTPQGEWHRRCSPTCTCTTFSIFGSTTGENIMRRAM